MGKSQRKVLRITMTVDYMVEEQDGRTNINDWPIEQVVKDWFEGDRFGNSHATRDGRQIGYSKRFLGYEFLTLREAQ